MSAIKHSLANLRNAVGRLEVSLHSMESAMAGQQRDMFAAAQPVKGNGKGFPVDSAIIAQRLDKAIQKVEELLKVE